MVGCFALTFSSDFKLYSNPSSDFEVALISTSDQLGDVGTGLTPGAGILPSAWHNSQATSTQKFRFKFSLDNKNSGLISVYIPSVRENAIVYLNNERIWQGNQGDAKTTSLWYHPILVSLPSGLLQENNSLQIDVASDGRQGGYLSKVYVGDHELLSKHKNLRSFLLTTVLQATSILLIVIGFIHLYLWSLRKTDSYYLWYALAAICWGIRGFLLVVPTLPISNELRVSFRTLMLGYGVVFVVLFNQRYFGFKSRLFNSAMWIYCLPLGLPLLFMGMESILFYGHQIWIRGTLLLGFLISLQLFYIFYYQKKMDAAYLLYSGLPLLIVGFRDMLVLQNRWSPENAFLINHLTLPALMVAMWFILKRLSNTLHHAEQLNSSLAERIEQKEQEIVVSFKEREGLLKQKLLSEERDRIMREIHDGIGSQLIGLKSLLSSKTAKFQDLNRYIDNSLIDLRIVINSLDIASQTLPSLLGSLRQQWQRSAESEGCILNWKVAPRPKKNMTLGPVKTLQMMRILQETFSNCLKHATPGEINVITHYSEELAIIEINNQCDKKPEISRGRGLKNIQERASKIGAKVSFNNNDGRFTLQVQLPLR